MELKYKNWKDVSIKKYYELEGVSTDELLDDDYKEIKILSLLCDTTEDEISRLPYPEFLQLKKDLVWLSRFSFDTEHDLKKVQVGDKSYRVCKDFSKFTTAQYIDFQTFYNKNDLKQYYGNVLSTFVIPEEYKEYNNGYDVVEEAKYLYDHLDICTANQLMFFFRLRWHNLTIVTLNYLKYLAKRNLKKKKLTEEERMIWTKIQEEIQDTPGWSALI